MTDDIRTRPRTPSTDGTVPESTERCPIGTLVIDTARQRLGRVMGHEGPYVQLRPPSGGREWGADPARIRPADENEILRVSVAAVTGTQQDRTQ
ncbi:hypothetical protein AB0N81_39060 [Streptomyces sp. NPDC093510]|uniref:hypothetical protein n=1 Tax=Streptomyces sp. NPDC093510 TaxID=3155199 RepID=UPI003433E2CB